MSMAPMARGKNEVVDAVHVGEDCGVACQALDCAQKCVGNPVGYPVINKPAQ